MAHPDFTLHPRLAADCRVVADLPLCRWLLQDDMRFPWCLLVLRRVGLTELDQLRADEAAQLFAEIGQVSAALRAAVPVDKLNVAALGNVVPQLHVHVVARTRGDAAWPGPVWGHGVAEPYPETPAAELIARLRSAAD